MIERPLDSVVAYYVSVASLLVLAGGFALLFVSIISVLFFDAVLPLQTGLVLAVGLLVLFWLAAPLARRSFDKAYDNFVQEDPDLLLVEGESMLVAPRRCYVTFVTPLGGSAVVRNVYVTDKRIGLGYLKSFPFTNVLARDEPGLLNFWHSNLKTIPCLEQKGVVNDALYSLSRSIGPLRVSDIALGRSYTSERFVRLRLSWWWPVFVTIYHPHATQLYAAFNPD